jgi:hypothetical protein
MGAQASLPASIFEGFSIRLERPLVVPAGQTSLLSKQGSFFYQTLIYL